jgi:hypothetical protein
MDFRCIGPLLWPNQILAELAAPLPSIGTYPFRQRAGSEAIRAETRQSL